VITSPTVKNGFAAMNTYVSRGLLGVMLSVAWLSEPANLWSGDATPPARMTSNVRNDADQTALDFSADNSPESEADGNRFSSPRWLLTQAEQDVPEHQAEQPTFMPQFWSGGSWNETGFFQLQLGAYAGDNTGVNDGFMSLEGRGGVFTDNGDSLFFIDTRLLLNRYQHAGANLGGGYRRYLPGQDLVFGANAYYDHWNTGDFGFHQVGAGVELLGPVSEIRSNVYVPIGTRTRQVGPAMGFVVGNDILARRNLQTALAGLDAEYGRLLWSREEVGIKGFLGPYYYHGSQGVSGSLGVRGRVELATRDLGNLNLSVQHDSIFDTTVMFGAEAYLFDRGLHRSPHGRPVYSRMADRVQRLQNIAVARHQRIDDTGLNAFFIQQGAAGSGGQNDPYGMADFSNETNFGPGDVAVLMDAGGPIVGNFTISESGQGIIGSADGSGYASTVLSDGTILELFDLGGRPTLDGQVQFLTSGFASGFDIATSTVVPIHVDSLGVDETVVIDNVNILDSVHSGIQIVNSAGQFQFLAGTTGGLISDVPGHGIEITNSSTDVLLDNVTIENVGLNAIHTNYKGTFVATGHTHIKDPGAIGIMLTNNVSTFLFEDLTIDGGGHGLYLAGFTGDFTVTGDATFSNQVSTGIFQPSAGGGNTSNLRFGTLTIDSPGGTESGFGVALENHQGTFTVDGAARIADNLSLGLFVKDSHTNFKFGALEIADTAGYAASFENHTGSVEVDGLFNIDHFGALGLQVLGGSTAFDVGRLEVASGTGYGIAMQNNTGDFIVREDATLSDFGMGALLVNNVTGDFVFDSLDVSQTGALAVDMLNHSGRFEVAGDASLTDVGNFGLVNRNSTTSFEFGSLEVQGAQFVGIDIEGGSGNFLVDGAVDIQGGNIGMQVLNRTGRFAFESLTAADNVHAGFVFRNVSGALTVTDDVVLTNVGAGAATTQAMQIAHSSGPFRFGSLAIDGNGNTAVDFRNNDGPLTIDGAFTASGFETGLDAGNNTGAMKFGSVEITGVGGNGTGMSIMHLDGGVTISGEAKFVNTGRDGAAFSNVAGDLSLGSLSVENTDFNGLFVSNVTGDLEIAGDVSMQTPGSFGIFINNLAGDASMASLAIDGATSTGLSITDLGGDFTVAGDGEITNTHQGIFLQNTTSDLSFANLSISDTTAVGLSLWNADSNVTVIGDATFDNTGAQAILSQNGSSGDFSFGTLSVENNWSVGVSLAGHKGDFTVDGDATFTAAGGTSILAQNTTTNFSFNSLDISGNWVTGVSLSNHKGDFIVDGDATFTAAGGTSILAQNTTTNFSFNSLDVSGNWVTGVSLSNHNGDFIVDGEATFANTGNSAILSQGNSTGDFSFDSLHVSGNVNNGVAMVGHKGDFTVTGEAVFNKTGAYGILAQNNIATTMQGDFTFGSLEISGTSSAALARHNVAGDFTVHGDASFTDVGSYGILAQRDPGITASGDYSFGSLKISDASQVAVALTHINGDFTVAGKTEFTDIGNYGMLLQNGVGDLSFGDLTIGPVNATAISLANQDGDVTAGVTTITSPGDHGILVHTHGGLMEFEELNISDPGKHGVALSIFSGDFTSDGGTISGINSNQLGFFKHESGDGTISLSDMTFTSDANDVFGMVALFFGDGGSVTLNDNQVIFSEGSTGTIGYRFGSYGADPADLNGAGNSTLNAVEPVFFDTLPGSFNGTVEIDGILHP
jgi:hypothetical protein